MSRRRSKPGRRSCGRYENRNEPASAEQRRKNECLLDAAAAGRPAELVITYYTVEGDPITSYYRVVGPRQIEILVDSTRDSFGAQKWTHELCAEIVQDSGFLYGERCRKIPVDRSVP